jgi:hypothetical protein
MQKTHENLFAITAMAAVLCLVGRVMPSGGNAWSGEKAHYVP